MRLRREIRTRIIEKLPRRYRFSIERAYAKSYPSESHLRGNLAVFKRLCKPDKAALDVGASYGIVSLFLCKFARQVYSFEPIPTIAEGLSQKFAGCNVTVENYALGNVEGELLLNIPCIGDKKCEEWSSLIKDFKNEIIRGNKVTSVERIKVKVKRLDGLDIKNIGFIKIDVEGFELEVLRGGENTIKKEMPILFIEIERRHHKQSSVYDVFNCLAKWGYLAYFVEGGKLKCFEKFDFDIMQNEEIGKPNEYINDFVFMPVQFSLGER